MRYKTSEIVWFDALTTSTRLANGDEESTGEWERRLALETSLKQRQGLLALAAPGR